MQEKAAELARALATAQDENQRLADANATLKEELAALRERQAAAEAKVYP